MFLDSLNVVALYIPGYKRDLLSCSKLLTINAISQLISRAAGLQEYIKLLHSVFPPKKHKKKGKADAEEVEEVEERSTEEDWAKHKDEANVRT